MPCASWSASSPRGPATGLRRGHRGGRGLDEPGGTQAMDRPQGRPRRLPGRATLAGGTAVVPGRGRVGGPRRPAEEGDRPPREHRGAMASPRRARQPTAVHRPRAVGLRLDGEWSSHRPAHPGAGRARGPGLGTRRAGGALAHQGSARRRTSPGSRSSTRASRWRGAWRFRWRAARTRMSSPPSSQPWTTQTVGLRPP